jgi:hypothetical protein
MKDNLIQIAIIASIMSQEIFEQLWDGDLSKHERIGQWSYEFLKKYKGTDWEAVHQTPLKGLFFDTVGDWESAIADFAYYKDKHK